MTPTKRQTVLNGPARKVLSVTAKAWQIAQPSVRIARRLRDRVVVQPQAQHFMAHSW
jgi:hypothetical protein